MTQELYDIDWRETSFVPAGDNPPARILFWKSSPEITDEEIGEILDQVAGEPRQEATMTTTGPAMTKRGDAVAEADRLAKSRYPELAVRNPAAARARVWAEAPELRDAVASLPAGEPVPEIPGPASLHKAAEPFAKLDAAARHELPDLYRRSPSMARTEAARLRPDLRDGYHRGHGAG